MKNKKLLLSLFFCCFFISLVLKASNVDSLTISTVFCLNKIKMDGYSFSKLERNKEQLVKDYNEVIKASKCDIIVQPSQENINKLKALFSQLNVTEYEFNQMRLIMTLIEKENSKNESNIGTGTEGNYSKPIIGNNNIFKKGDIVNIGNWSVMVPKFFNSNRLLTKVLRECEIHYLVFPIEITNNSKKSLNCPLITLVDENNNEFNWSNKTKVKVYLDGKDISMWELDNYLPSITKVKILIFDAPPDRDYKLKIYDNHYDFNSKEFKFIDLLQ